MRKQAAHVTDRRCKNGTLSCISAILLFLMDPTTILNFVRQNEVRKRNFIIFLLPIGEQGRHLEHIWKNIFQSHTTKDDRPVDLPA